MAYLTTRPIDELYSLSVNFFPHPLLSTTPAKSAPSGEMQLTAWKANGLTASPHGSKHASSAIYLVWLGNVLKMSCRTLCWLFDPQIWIDGHIFLYQSPYHFIFCLWVWNNMVREKKGNYGYVINWNGSQIEIVDIFFQNVLKNVVTLTSNFRSENENIEKKNKRERKV
jgi:hypothetical protein